MSQRIFDSAVRPDPSEKNAETIAQKNAETIAQENAEKIAKNIDFVGLHNIAKHIVYLKESCEAMMTTVDCIISSRFPENQQVIPADTCSRAQRALNYRRGAFHSTQLRLISMEKRMENLIQLGFNLVAQKDSFIAQQDSRRFEIDNKLLKLIAVLTLVFLPTSTIASIFGTQFFVFNQPQQDSTGDNNSASDMGIDLVMSRQFWIFWVLVAVTTTLVCSSSLVYFYKVKKSITERPPCPA